MPAHPSSKEDVSSDDWRSSDYSPPWSKVNELNKSVPMDVDRVVVVKAQDDMEIDNDLVEANNDL